MMKSVNLQQSERRQLCQKDAHAVKEVISKVKSQGLFDQFRKECLADVDTKPAYHNLVHRVEKFVERFLNGQKWSTDLNKNQLRETLRRHLNNSGVMNLGVDRIIEQVVNPKIILGIKPKIDEAVCDHFGIDLKIRQEEQLKQKQEQQRLMLQQQQFHQHRLQNLINEDVKSDDGFARVASVLSTPITFPWAQGSGDANFSGTPSSGMTNLTASRANFNPHILSFGGMMHHNFISSWAPGLPEVEDFSQIMRPAIPDQAVMLDFGGGYSPTVVTDTPFIPTTSPPLDNVNTSFSIPPMQIQSVTTNGVHDFTLPPLGPHGNHLLNSSTSIGSSSVHGFSQQPNFLAPPGILTNVAGTIIKPPPPGSIPPPPGTVTVIPPVPFTPCQIPLHPVSSIHMPSVNSSDVPKLFKEELAFEEVLGFRNTEKYFVEQQIHAGEQNKLITEFEFAKEEEGIEETKTKETLQMMFDDREGPVPLKHNSMNIFQDAQVLSENESTFDLSIDTEETADKHKDVNMIFDDFGKQHLHTGSILGKVDTT